MKVLKIFVKSVGVLVVLLAVAILALAFGIHKSRNRELLSTRNAHTDENQINDVYLGPLVFHIKNQFLAYPFSHDSRPFDASICGKPNLRDINREVCSSSKKSVRLQMKIPHKLADDSRSSMAYGAILGYGQGYVFHEASAEDFVAQKTLSEGGKEHIETKETENYIGVHVLPSEQFVFIGKTLDVSPHEIICRNWNSPNQCTARAGFLKDEFPRDAKGLYPFTLWYDIPSTEIDQAPEIEAEMLQAVADLPHERFSQNQ